MITDKRHRTGLQHRAEDCCVCYSHVSEEGVLLIETPFANVLEDKVTNEIQTTHRACLGQRSVHNEAKDVDEAAPRLLHVGEVKHATKVHCHESDPRASPKGTVFQSMPSAGVVYTAMRALLTGSIEQRGEANVAQSRRGASPCNGVAMLTPSRLGLRVLDVVRARQGDHNASVFPAHAARCKCLRNERKRIEYEWFQQEQKLGIHLLRAEEQLAVELTAKHAVYLREWIDHVLLPARLRTQPI